MRKAMILIGAVALAAPASAQAPAFHDPLDRSIAHGIPKADEVEAIAPALDQMLGALLQIDVGPFIDAADPYRRRVDHGVSGRTLGELAHRDDPYFEDRTRESIYGVTRQMGRMMESIAVAAPAMRRSIREFERGIEVAVEDFERGRDSPRDYRAPREYWPQDGY